MEATSDLSMVAERARDSKIVPLYPEPSEGALSEIDTVDERLAASAELAARIRSRYGAKIAAHQAMIARLDEYESQYGSLSVAMAAARLRLHRRIDELLHVVFVFAAEQHAEIDGARRHLGFARQSVRIATFVAERAGWEEARLAGVV